MTKTHELKALQAALTSYNTAIADVRAAVNKYLLENENRVKFVRNFGTTKTEVEGHAISHPCINQNRIEIRVEYIAPRGSRCMSWVDVERLVISAGLDVPSVYDIEESRNEY